MRLPVPNLNLNLPNPSASASGTVDYTVTLLPPLNHIQLHQCFSTLGCFSIALGPQGRGSHRIFYLIKQLNFASGYPFISFLRLLPGIHHDLSLLPHVTSFHVSLRCGHVHLSG